MLKNKSILFVILLICALVFSGCGESTTESKANNDVSVDTSSFPKGISIGSSALGGTYNNYATGWANIISKTVGVATNVEVTAGPSINIQLVDRGETDFGLATMGTIYEAYNGIIDWDKEYPNIRTVFPMYITYLHYVALPDANVKSISDLEGKVIGPAGKGSTPDIYTRRLIEDKLFTPSRIVNASYSDYSGQMSDGQLDVFTNFSPANHPTTVEVIKTMNCNVIGVGERSAELAKKYGITSGILKANSYEGQTEDIETLTVWSAYIANKDLSEDFVYEVVKSTFENQEQFARVIKEGKELSLDAVPEICTVPLHPGAIKYYTEMGIELPDSAYPPEYQK